MRVVTATMTLQVTVRIPKKSDGYITGERLRSNLNGIINDAAHYGKITHYEEGMDIQDINSSVMLGHVLVYPDE